VDCEICKGFELFVKSAGEVNGESKGIGGARHDTGGKTGFGTLLFAEGDDGLSVMIGGKTRSLSTVQNN